MAALFSNVLSYPTQCFGHHVLDIAGQRVGEAHGVDHLRGSWDVVYFDDRAQRHFYVVATAAFELDRMGHWNEIFD